MNVRVRYLDASGLLQIGEVYRGPGGRVALRPSDARSFADPVRAGESAFSEGIITGHFTDWHVHLQLVNPRMLSAGVIGRVLDLGGDPTVLDTLHRDPPEGITVEFTGAFLTAPGGYPSDRAWAPTGSVRELVSVSAAQRAVQEMARWGAFAIKLASNRDAGPVLGEETVRAIFAAAAQVGLPVVVHAEGAGEAMRLHGLGARVFAHTPFSEQLTADQLRAVARDSTWISTLDVHGWGVATEKYATALSNLGGFHRAGGNIRYGTDLGNGPLPTGLNARELAGFSAAGLNPMQQLATLTPSDPLLPDTRLICVPGASIEMLSVSAARPLRLAAHAAAQTINHRPI